MLVEWIYLIVLISCLVLNIVLTMVSWTRKQNKTAYWFTLMQLSITILALCYLFSSVSTNDTVAFFWVRLRFIFINLSTITFMMVALALTGKEHWIHYRIYLPLLIVPIITGFIMWFQPNQFWQHWERVPGSVIHLENTKYIGWFIVHTIQNYILLVAGCSRIIRYAFESTSVSRKQAWLFSSGVFAVIVLSVLPTFGLTDDIPNPIPIALTLLSLLLFWSIIKHGLLHLSSAAYHKIIDHMEDVVLLLDSHNRIVLANRIALTMLDIQDESEIIGRQIYEFSQYFENLSDVADDNWKGQHEIQVQCDESIVNMDLRISAIYNEQGKRTHKLFVLRDITERKIVEQQRFELEVEQERANILANFIKDVSHEFRTPLSIINTNSHLIKRLDDPIRREAKAQTISEQVQRITKLIDTMLLTIRINHDAVCSPDNTNSVDINSLAYEVSTIYQAQYGSFPQLTFVPATDLPKINGNSELLQIAITQVIHNAYRYTSNSGQISVQLGSNNTYIWIAVKDTGEGIEEADIRHIFKRFWRKDIAHSTPGFGLGLALVKSIVDYHCGKVEVTSQLTRGTTVMIHLPIET